MVERLTHRDSKGDVWIKDAAHVDEQGQICMLSERLAQYEDIGLTPDEITDMIYRFEAFLCEMTGNRMSKSNYTLDAMISVANDYQQSLCDECWDRSELAKYYELEHEKRLVVLPCKVGQRVWVIKDGKIDEGFVKWFDTGDPLNPQWTAAIQDAPRGPVFVPIESVYITREEAEKALLSDS